MRSRLLKPLAAASLALAAAIGLAACAAGEQQTGGRHKLDLKIGDLVPLSGVESAWGAPGQKAANLAVSQIRKAIGQTKADHTVTITHQNYRSEAKFAQDLASKLIQNGTSCLIGPWSSGSVNAVASQTAVPKKTIEITPGASSDALNKLFIGGYVNRTIAPDHLQGEALASAMADELGGAKNKKVSIGAIKNVYGTSLTTTFAAAWKELGGKVAARVVYETNLPNYKKQAQDLVAPKPDAFVFFDFQETYTRVATELLKTKKWKPSKTFAADSLAISTLGQNGGATVAGLRGVAPSWPRFGDLFEAFQRLYKAGPPPPYRQPYDAQAFDAVILCYLAAVAAGSTKGTEMKRWVRNVSSPPGTKYNWQQLPDAIQALEAGKDINYEGASGPIDIEPLDTLQSANPTAGFYDLYRYTDARLALYASVSVPPSKKGVEHFPVRFVTPKVPGATPPPPPPGTTGATGATGANGKAAKPGARGEKKKKKKQK